MKTIIALTNFSESSNNAATYAAEMCTALHAELALVHVIQMPVSFEVPLTEYEYSVAQEDVQASLLKLKEKLLLRTNGSIEINTKVLAGTMVHEIGDIGADKKPFLVVIGAERRHWTERFIVGSNTFITLKNLHYPVLVVPTGAIFKHIERIALASDFQDIDEVPVEILRQLVAIFNASIDIIHVNSNTDDEIKSAVAFAHLRDHLKEFNPHTHFITGSNVEQAINNYAEEHNEDLVMVISRKHNFFESLTRKSQSKQITLDPHIPVLAVAE